MDDTQQDICRVCRSEGSLEKPLFHPCICTGSIKYIHQECLVQWLKYSRKEFCELCNHRFSFMPIYSPDMPQRLPVKDIFSGLLTSLGTAIRYWLHYTLVAFAWLGVVPLTACRIYRCLFTGSVSSLLTLPLDMLSTENLVADSFYGCCVVTCTLCAFISLVWLREQILHGGGPEWLEQEQDPPLMPQPLAVADGDLVLVPANNNVEDQQLPPAEGAAEVDGDEADGPDLEVNDGNNGAQGVFKEEKWENNVIMCCFNLLGLDGSLVFLEHVFWVVSLNTLFILVFAFCPYHIGHFTLVGFKLKDYVTASQFEGLLTTLSGYVVIGLVLILLHGVASLVKLRKTKQLLGLCYVVVKVSLLSVLEIGVFPLMCGWWLDICSLTILDTSLQDREASFKAAPGTFMFIHWLVGMVYVFYFASFILLLREVLRPGALWFLPNLYDPDFNPIQEMVRLPILRHIRRFLASIVIFGMVVLLMVWVPVQLIRKVFPEFLPYNVVLSSETPVSELSLELILLQVVLPAVLEQGHTRQWLKSFVRGWCIAVSYVLELRSYLLGDVPLAGEDDKQPREEQEAQEERPNVNVGDQGNPVPDGFQVQPLGIAHQEMLHGAGPVTFQPYYQPRFFAFRLVCLLGFICLSLFIGSLIMLTLPGMVWSNDGFGFRLSNWFQALASDEGEQVRIGKDNVKDRKVIVIGDSLVRKIRKFKIGGVNAFYKLTSKSLLATSVLLGVIPLLMGLLFDLVIIIPLRVSLHQTPILYIWQDWALGVLHTKIVCAVTLMGPNWWLKRLLEQVYHDGIRNISLKLIIMDLALPVIITLGSTLALPYLFSCSILPMFGAGFEMQNLIFRRIYPSLLASVVIAGIIVFQVMQFFYLYEHIRNDNVSNIFTSDWVLAGWTAE
ncbi:E3 ubiquitin-protein ligase MARCH6-like [Limulus polyphemus]|uniref:RING-type E3 ubiquitin transferase n=1 Tax=Limulus polyphemus TaxID=6850 RepID=A0ABM1T6R1_LIMPO|nr:E3 ubiquitin-protein ligase MARCH6-like [Limulus polyphemus]